MVAIMGGGGEGLNGTALYRKVRYECKSILFELLPKWILIDAWIKLCRHFCTTARQAVESFI